MPEPLATRYIPSSPSGSYSRTPRAVNVAALLCVMVCASSSSAQITLGSAVDLALRNSPRIQMAQSDVARARAILSQSKDVYVPTLNVGAAIGDAFGYSFNPPTLFTLSAGSLIYNASQPYYMRSARSGISSADSALEDAREGVAEDAALTFIGLDHDQQREAAIRQQSEFAATLVRIVEERVAAGHDNQLDLTQAKLTAAQLRLSLLHAQDDLATDQEHLARLMGIAPDSLRADGGVPSTLETPDSPSKEGYANAGIAAAFQAANARQQQAVGDSKFLYRPQFSLAVQYNRYDNFTSSFKQLQDLNAANIGISPNEAAFGVLITIPVIDKMHQARARQSLAEADRSFREAQNAQFLSLDGQSHLRHSIGELQARAEVAALEQQLAQQQLEVLRIQLQSSGNPDGPQMTPKDEQTARIGEREKYLNVVDAAFLLHQAQISLLRQRGELLTWLKSAALLPTAPATAPRATPQTVP